VALRAAARAGVLSMALQTAPVPATGRLWLLRLGLDRLRQAPVNASDWCWLVDHTALLGRQRLFVVLGVRLDAWAPAAARGQGSLHLADVQVLHIAALIDPDAAQVQTQLQTLAAQTGLPRAVVSDHGADVRAGVTRFRASHAAVADLYDIKHFAANRLKALLQAAPAWATFQTRLGQVRAALQQTEWAFVVPPALRTKSRYLNLDVLLQWAAKGRALLAVPAAERAQRGSVERLERALGWLRDLEETLAEWQEWLTVTEAAVRAVRDRGVYVGAAAALAEQLRPLRRYASGQALAAVLVDFVQTQQAQAQAAERLVGSTEVLESLFGRFKALSREHSRGGVTALALALPALLSTATSAEVAQALARCKTADVRDWVKKHLAPNLQQQRCWLRSLLPRRPRKKRQTKQPLVPP
jgi:hypothetical protein